MFLLTFLDLLQLHIPKGCLVMRKYENPYSERSLSVITFRLNFNNHLAQILVDCQGIGRGFVLDYQRIFAGLLKPIMGF